MTDTGMEDAKVTKPKPCPCCPVCNPKGPTRTTELGETPKRKFFRAED